MCVHTILTYPASCKFTCNGFVRSQTLIIPALSFCRIKNYRIHDCSPVTTRKVEKITTFRMKCIQKNYQDDFTRQLLQIPNCKMFQYSGNFD